MSNDFDAQMQALLRRQYQLWKRCTPANSLYGIAQAAFCYGYACGLVDLKSGNGTLVKRDKELESDGLACRFESGVPAFPVDIKPALTGRMHELLAACGVQLSSDFIADLDIDAVKYLKD